MHSFLHCSFWFEREKMEPLVCHLKELRGGGHVLICHWLCHYSGQRLRLHAVHPTNRLYHTTAATLCRAWQVGYSDFLIPLSWKSTNCVEILFVVRLWHSLKVRWKSEWKTKASPYFSSAWRDGQIREERLHRKPWRSPLKQNILAVSSGMCQCNILSDTIRIVSLISPDLSEVINLQQALKRRGDSTLIRAP